MKKLSIGFMRSLAVISITMACFTIGSMALAGSYAPKVKITSSTSPMGQMVIKASKVPDKSSVGIPPYPGAKILQTMDKSEMVVNDEKIKTLPYIKLLSTDPVEKVIDWYKDHLKGYTYEDVFGVSWIFWKGHKKFNGLDMRFFTTIENVRVSEAIAAMIYGENMKGSKSIIEIYYEPK